MNPNSLIWSQLGSIMASFMFMYTMFERFFPRYFCDHVKRYLNNLTDFTYPYIHVTFPEFSGEKRYDVKRSEAYTSIQAYLGAKACKSSKRLKAEEVKDSQNHNNTTIVLSIDDYEEITDLFQGVKLWWSAKFLPTSSHRLEENRVLTLIFHKRYRDLITSSYVQHVLEEGRRVLSQNRTLRLYTNNPSDDWSSYKSTKWSHMNFEHPSRFETLAMDPKKKEEIINDLVKFKNGKEYYASIGKAWKRGYLLYGPPGTGKSSMIAAMANFMNYDVYDLELTTVKENIELRKLLIETKNKSIIVIEDIDCSIDLTGQRNQQKENVEKEKVKKGSKVTLSGLLNFIDGIWSACGGERIIIFTTNYVEKLDPALIRRGRMDKHIEMSYCGYEAFKVFAKNYLDVESHSLFPIIEKMLAEINMSPADVAENLMPKSIVEDSDTCFKNLIESLEEAKQKAEEEAKQKAEEEAKQKVEEEAKQKAEEEAKKKNKEDEDEDTRLKAENKKK